MIFSPTLIFWDWNGTLLDDVGASLAAVNDMRFARRRPPLDLPAYRAAIDVPIRRFYEIHFDLAQEDYAAVLREYNAAYLRHLPSCGLAEGAVEVLKALQSRQIRQVILTSGQQENVERALAHFGVAEYFDAVLGASDTLAGFKDERATMYLRAHRIPPQEVLVVGDLVHDYALAQGQGTQCVLVGWGHQSRAEFGDLPVAVLHNLAEIMECIR
ncbi:MAG: HAD family hydrolase [Oscillospiraceae bacterium]|jgi:phosphoglycolate phosphatase|nr:HAD family hydrolase [Oscillospiraceae bacterium]